MKKEILARCGFRCDLCLAYKDNIENNDQRQFLSDGWHKIYRFRIPPDNIYCDGCINAECLGGGIKQVTHFNLISRYLSFLFLSKMSKLIYPTSLTPKLIDKDCPVRPCVIEKGIENGSQCDDYICDKLKDRIVVYEDLLKRDDIKISRKEYINFIKPYENKKSLEALRKENYPHSRMLNKEIIPNENILQSFLGDNDIILVWNNITSFINNNYNFGSKIIFGGKKYGWAVTYKHGQKTIVTLFPESKSFTVLLVFGKKELENIFENKDIFTKQILQLIEKTKQYHDGKWIWIRIENHIFKKDICNLIKIKKKPQKKNILRVIKEIKG